MLQQRVWRSICTQQGNLGVQFGFICYTEQRAWKARQRWNQQALPQLDGRVKIPHFRQRHTLNWIYCMSILCTPTYGNFVRNEQQKDELHFRVDVVVCLKADSSQHCHFPIMVKFQVALVVVLCRGMTLSDCQARTSLLVNSLWLSPGANAVAHKGKTAYVSCTGNTSMHRRLIQLSSHQEMMGNWMHCSDHLLPMKLRSYGMVRRRPHHRNWGTNIIM